jgi:hypothetical protein
LQLREGAPEHCRADDRGERPHQKAVRGIAEISLVFVHGFPLRAQTPGKVAADGRGQHRDHDQVDPGGDGERGAGNSGIRPGRND